MPLLRFQDFTLSPAYSLICMALIPKTTGHICAPWAIWILYMSCIHCVVLEISCLQAFFGQNQSKPRSLYILMKSNISPTVYCKLYQLVRYRTLIINIMNSAFVNCAVVVVQYDSIIIHSAVFGNQ